MWWPSNNRADFAAATSCSWGILSPLDGVGPAELGLDDFERLLADGEVREVILATNPTAEGEATAHYLGELALRLGLKASRIAHGVPVGGELEYVDGGTLAHALAGRTNVSYRRRRQGASFSYRRNRRR